MNYTRFFWVQFIPVVGRAVSPRPPRLVPAYLRRARRARPTNYHRNELHPFVPDAGNAVEVVKEFPQQGCDRKAEGLVFMGLNLDGEVIVLLPGNEPGFVEKNRFSHTPKPGEKDALFRLFQFNPAQKNADLFQYQIASNKFRWWRPGSWGERFVDWIHD